MKKILSIVVPIGFQPIEYSESRRALEEAGYEVKVASTTKTAVDSRGQEYAMDLTLDEASAKDFDAILFVGGPGTKDHFDDPEFQRLAKEFYAAGKLTTAICAAPVILGRAGLLKGKKVTSFPSHVENVQQTGGLHTGNSVERDGLIITADGPGSAYKFGEEIGRELINHSNNLIEN